MTTPSPDKLEIPEAAVEAYPNLREANIARQAAWCPEQLPDLSFRGNELAGETGEVCNVIKKLERERLGWRGSRDTVEHLAEELADVVICADLCAISAGIDLNQAVEAKFNATSEKVGLPHRLAALPHIPDRGYAGVGVKPLKWTEYAGLKHDFGSGSWEGYGHDRTYTILDVGTDGKNGYRYYLKDREQFETLEEAKSSAEAHYESGIRSALIAAPAPVDRGYAEGIEAAAVFTNCCVCGRVVDTREAKDGGDPFGSEMSDGRWTCSGECWDELVDPAPPAPADNGDLAVELRHLATSAEALTNLLNPHLLPEGAAQQLETTVHQIGRAYAALSATLSPIEDVAEPSITVNVPSLPDEMAQTISFSKAIEVLGNILDSGWDPETEAAFVVAIDALSARRVRPSPVDEDALTSLQDEQREFARKASVETDPLLKERWSGISVGMHSVLASLQSQRKG